jgi:ribonuclease BN (tRNA processing enzyme)
MELIVLGCSGSYGGPRGAACSGYLVRDGDTAVWLDCGNGTFGHLQQHIQAEELTAVVITHEHPDHCVDVYGLHVLMKWGLEREGFPVYAPEGLDEHLGTLVGGDWGGAFEWRPIDDGAHTEIGCLGLRFSRTDHPPPTYAVEVEGNRKRLVYTCRQRRRARRRGKRAHAVSCSRISGHAMTPATRSKRVPTRSARL